MSKVVFANVKEYEQQQVTEAVKQMFEQLGGLKSFVKEGSKVFLKLNLVREMSADKAATTHPTVVNAVASLLQQECNATVVVGDSCGGLYTPAVMNSVYRGCGLKEGEKQGLYTLNQDFSSTSTPIGGKVLGSVEIINAFLNADCVINLAKLKTHSFTGYSGAAKNLFGLIPGLVKVEMHATHPQLDDFCDLLCDVADFAQSKIVLHLIDAIVGMEGPGPTNGTPKHIGKLFCGTNPYHVDVCAVTLFDEPAKMPLLQKAIQRDSLSQEFSEIDCDLSSLKADYIADYKRVQVSNDAAFLHLPAWIRFLAEKFLTQKVKMRKRRCKKCKKCEIHCPAKAIEMGKKKAIVDHKKCIRCFCCQELCPFDAVEIKESLLLKTTRWLSSTKTSKKRPK
ncbi:MAG: DUF362 domain-containing protein [Clostridia bacterium]|nr:DUF362 domain-containing protein [Clostridia bacterium]